MRRAVLALVAAVILPAAAGAQAPPRILMDVSPRAVEYQLRRLSNDELAMIERRPEEPRYRPVYYALLTRTGLARRYRDEALGVLVTMDGASRPRVLLTASTMVASDDEVAAARLIGQLLSEPIADLRRERQPLREAVGAADAPGVSRRAAFAALLVLDGTAAGVASLAAGESTRLIDLLRAVPLVVEHGGAQAAAPAIAQWVAGLLDGDLPAAARPAAVAALGAVAADRAAAQMLVREFHQAADEAVWSAAVGALLGLPLTLWPPDAMLSVGQAVVTGVGNRPPSQRTSPAVIDALRLGDRLAAALPAERAVPLRRELAALGVRVVTLETVPEQMRFTLTWFVVEAGRRVQIVLVNRDAMPHNVVLGRPGSLEAIGTAASTMPMPADPGVAPYVPASPDVLAATKLVWEGQTERLNFTAPTVAGQYIFACTYPGHWARMYGVMLVVENLEAWEANPTFPVDPITGQPLR